MCDPDLDELLLTNERNHGWDTEQYLSDVLIAGFEESERKTSEAYRKVFARARFALYCAAPRGVGDVRLVCRERVLSDAVGPCGYRLHSGLSRKKGSECRSCVVAPNTIYFAFIAENCLVS